MTQGSVEMDPDDAEAIRAYEEALRSFAIDLTRFHINFGAPSYSQLVKASVRPKLTKAGVNEAFSGKRLPSREALAELVRVVSAPPESDGPSPVFSRPQAGLIAQWRDRWVEVKFLQRQAQAPWKRVRNTAQELLEQAVRDAEEIRAAAHAQADQIVAAARAEAEVLWASAVRAFVLTKGSDSWLDPSLRTLHVDAKELLPAWKAAEHEYSLIFTGKRKWDFTPPFWTAVPNPTVLMPEDGGPLPVARLEPGTWYLAVEWRGSKLVLQTRDNRRGILHDTIGIQKG
ncbi:hypothetical protein [Streptomyces sp. HUAS TT3]|uniref:hypothetical protein n=1 Tax=Streptomyces sp. HUAS TT3 TaxID=3447510 RepID=UPI003F6584EC